MFRKFLLSALLLGALLGGIVSPITAPATTVGATGINLNNYWKFSNCKYATFYNYNAAGNLLSPNYTSYVRWWTGRNLCSDTWVRYNIKSPNCAGCYYGPGSDGDLAFYFDNAATITYNGSSLNVIAGAAFVNIPEDAGWGWCGSDDVDPSDDGSSWARFRAGTDGKKAYVYSPHLWDFAADGDWIYTVNDQQYNYVYAANQMCAATGQNRYGGWALRLSYLGEKTFGTSNQFTGNVVKVEQYEIRYHTYEVWYLMEYVGIVQIEQHTEEEMKVIAKLYSWGDDSGTGTGNLGADLYCP